MAKTEVFRVGSITFIGPVTVDNGTTGFNERPRIIVDGLGDLGLWGSAEDYRAAAQFFLDLAHTADQERLSLDRAIAQSCEPSQSCGCSYKQG